MNPDELRAKAREALESRARIFEQRKAVVDDTTLTDAEKREQVERMDADLDRLGDEARHLADQADREAELRSVAARVQGGNPGTAPAEQRSERDLAAEFRAVALGEQRALEVTLGTGQSTDNLTGAREKQFVRELQEALEWRSPFLSYVRNITTGTGEVMEWPVKVSKMTHENIGTVAEGQVYPNGTGPRIERKGLGAVKRGALIEVTYEAATDPVLDILGIVAADAGEAMGDLLVRDAFRGAGDGLNGPKGWATYSTAGVDLGASTFSALTGDNLIDLQHSLAVPYRRNAVFMVADEAVATLRKLKDGDGRYLWQPSLVVGQPDLIFGRPALIDPLVSEDLTKPVYYGDPSKYLMRTVRNIEVTRSDERGWDKDVITFKVSWRGSGFMLDENGVKHLSATAPA